jgi:ABC-type antimicrobial peptide transport system permease subunit
VPRRAGGATTRNAAFLGTLASVLRVVAAVNGLVCLYAVLAALALVAGERRSLVALLRAVGGRRRDVAAVFAGAAGLLVLLAAPAALVLERLVLGPLVAHLAAGYAGIALAPSPAQTALAAAGLALVAATAAAVTTRRALSAPVVAGLREDGA